MYTPNGTHMHMKQQLILGHGISSSGNKNNNLPNEEKTH